LIDLSIGIIICFMLSGTVWALLNPSSGRHPVNAFYVNLVIIIPVKQLPTHTTANVVATLALPAVACHGGQVLVARSTVPASKRQVSGHAREGSRQAETRPSVETCN
jgi:hypothetical protein